MSNNHALKTGCYRGHDIRTCAHGAESSWLADFFVTHTESNYNDIVLVGGTASVRFTNERQATDEAIDAAKRAIDVMLDCASAKPDSLI
jgi:hypothetical protein